MALLGGLAKLGGLLRGLAAGAILCAYLLTIPSTVLARVFSPAVALSLCVAPIPLAASLTCGAGVLQTLGSARLKLTGATYSTAVLGGQGVLSGEGMTSEAVALAVVLGRRAVSAPDVYSDEDDFHVGGVYAWPIAAKVVNCQRASPDPLSRYSNGESAINEPVVGRAVTADWRAVDGVAGIVAAGPASCDPLPTAGKAVMGFVANADLGAESFGQERDVHSPNFVRLGLSVKRYPIGKAV